MDWSAQIRRFAPVSREEVPFFAPPREMEQAIGIYNKAIFNLNHESQDIALIALRKLASTYPLFPQPTFLLGCCQALAGQTEEARDLIDQAVMSGLPDDMQQDALFCQFELKELLKHPAPAPAGHAADYADGRSLPPIRAAGVLEKTRRGGKVKMASERERQDVLRRSEFPEEEETHVQMRREPVEYLRVVLPIVAGILLVATLVIAAVRWLPQTGLFQGRDRNAASDKLAWLLTELDRLSGDDAAIAGLMADYRARFEPTPTPSPVDSSAGQSESGAAGESTQASPSTQATTADETVQTATAALTTATATTAATTATTTDPAVEALLSAADHYDQGKLLRASDLPAAAGHLLEARSLLAGIPGQTTAAGLTGDATDLSKSVEDLIGEIDVDAAEQLRQLGMTAFDAGHYQEALTYFLPAYQLYPRAYGGGVAYYCGRCYQLLGDKAAAKPYFEFVIDQFSGRDIAGSAAGRLAEMGY